LVFPYRKRTRHRESGDFIFSQEDHAGVPLRVNDEILDHLHGGPLDGLNVGLALSSSGVLEWIGSQVWLCAAGS